MTAQWEARVTLRDVNGMEMVIAVQVGADDPEAAKEAAKAVALEQAEDTGAHVAMIAEVENDDLRLLD